MLPINQELGAIKVKKNELRCQQYRRGKGMKGGKWLKGRGKKSEKGATMQGGDGERNHKHEKAPVKTGHTDHGLKGNMSGALEHSQYSSSPLTSARPSQIHTPAVARRSFSTCSARALETFEMSYHESRVKAFKKRHLLRASSGSWTNALKLLDIDAVGNQNHVKLLEHKAQRYDDQFRMGSRTAFYRLLQTKGELKAAASTLPFR
jgi:hypothetical protein